MGVDEKPHIVFDTEFKEYHCESCGISGYGDTVKEAYQNYIQYCAVFEKLRIDWSRIVGEVKGE